MFSKPHQQVFDITEERCWGRPDIIAYCVSFVFFFVINLHSLCIFSGSSSGSFTQTSEKSISSVKGGRSEYAAALAWEQKGAPPESTIYKDWVESTIDNPAVIDYEVRNSPISQTVLTFH